MIDYPATTLPVISNRNDLLQLPCDERKGLSVGLLLMFADAYHKMLECATGAPCAELDMKFNRSYLWVVQQIRHLLLRHEDLADFPLRFHAMFADLTPSTIRDADWEETVAPEVEKFITAIQMYSIDHGIHEPEAGSAVWIFLQRIRPRVDEAINAGLDYRRRMESQANPPRRRSRIAKDQRGHDNIRKNIDRIPELIEKVERTPQKTVAMLSGASKRRMKAAGAVVEEHFTASQHYRNINWQGRMYMLVPNAAKIVEALHDAHRSLGLPGLHQKEIFSRAFGSDQKKWPSRSSRVQNFFRTGDAKRLWDDGFIEHDSKGNFWLNKADATRTESG